MHRIPADLTIVESTATDQIPHPFESARFPDATHFALDEIKGLVPGYVLP